jgi:hypothetical protein
MEMVLDILWWAWCVFAACWVLALVGACVYGVWLALRWLLFGPSVRRSNEHSVD